MLDCNTFHLSSMTQRARTELSFNSMSISVSTTIWQANFISTCTSYDDVILVYHGPDMRSMMLLQKRLRNGLVHFPDVLLKCAFLDGSLVDPLCLQSVDVWVLRIM